MTDDEFSGILVLAAIDDHGRRRNRPRSEPWGKKRLAYRVQKFDEGYYALLFHQSPAAVVHEVERRITMNERLMKFLTVKVDWEERGRSRGRARRPPGAPGRIASRRSDRRSTGFDAPGDMDGGR